ncbi:SDR family oxidoreductase [Floccifex sp.]|uniref:SDR family oxidoreductase n=1 Tax=Floccifex sp. TaxID=2815810 RepID=UPI003EFE3B72
MKTILVTGANGYLASLCMKEHPEFNYIKMTRKNADLSCPEQVEEFLSDKEFDICFHTAANATTALCEQNPELANKINVQSTQKIIEACKRNKARLIFSGTEQSFNGKEEKGPFKEDEPLKAVTVYGQNKADCEALIQSQLNDYVILRYSWQMGLSFDGIKSSPNIVQNVMKALITNTPTLFTVNEKRCLTYAKHIATQFDRIIELPTGIYHCASSNEFNTYQAAKYIARTLNVKEEIIDQIILPNKDRYSDRFRDYRLDSSKIQSYGIHFATFEEDVQEILKEFGWIK